MFRIPPHSGPIPPGLDLKFDIPQRPPTPTRFMPESAPTLPASPPMMTEEFKTDDSTIKAGESPALQDTDSAKAEKTMYNIRPYRQIQRRHRKDREQHSLLTPPLTPSSSIRTTASSDSSGNHGVKQGDGLEASSATEGPGNDDLGATRFLLVSPLSICHSAFMLFFALYRRPKFFLHRQSRKISSLILMK